MGRLGLCWRCEWRARYYETETGPRAECQTPTHSSCSCYMYRPVAPYVIKENEGDKRPLTLNAFSCRVHPVSVAECAYEARRVRKKGYVIWAVPKIEERKGGERG